MKILTIICKSLRNCVLGNLMRDRRNLTVEIVSFLSHREDGAMAHPHDREYER
jgi:hypothetical protein